MVRQLLAGGTPCIPFDFSLIAAGAVDQGLVQWLQELNVDSGTIQTVRGRVLAIPKPHHLPCHTENLNVA